MSFEPILLAPQKEEKEIIPYRRVWRTTVFEIAILLALTLLTVLATRLVKTTLSDTQRALIGLGYAVVPFSLWVIFSYWGELRAPQPRERLFTVVALSALAANAIGVPLLDRALAVDQWLATAPATTRILGYALTTGITQEFLKYIVIRYSVWPRCFRTRTDGIAYGIAAGIGYATVLNLNYALTTTADPASIALRISEFTLMQVSISTIMSYALAELKMSSAASIFWLPSSLILASVLTGLGITFRGGLVVSAVSERSNASVPLQGLGAALFLTFALLASFYFLINNADERARMRGQAEFLP